MKSITLTTLQWYQINAELGGWDIVSNDGKRENIIPGFLNEKSISEGVRRIAYKMNKSVSLELNDIDKRKKEILTYKEEEKNEQEIAAIIKGKLKEIDEDKINIDFSEVPDFKLIEKLSLSHNYSFLFEHIFDNY